MSRRFGVVVSLVSLGLSLAHASWASAAERLTLWEVKSPQATVYLYGSIHVCKTDCFPLNRAVLQRFDESTELAVELDPERPDTQNKLMAAARLPAGENLSTKLEPPDRELLNSVLSTVGLPAPVIDTFQPWMAATLITVVAARQYGYEPANGVDVWLLQRAIQQGKTIVELETAERQIEALAGGSDAEQLDALRQTLGMVRTGRIGDYLGQLMSAWRRGDIKRIDQLAQESIPSGSSYGYELLDRRNIEMADRIEEMLQQRRRVFIAVGAAHMAGVKGIPSLLRNKGYRVEQVSKK